ncbi:Kynureninase (L-kynurenine hydrolase) [Collariella sp. IMI 366227]|nr:Kynureninase (L-kynurenine hydrolase) [Collariella sp. IMI 366227]
MDAKYQSFIDTLRAGEKPKFGPKAQSIEYARQLDSHDQLKSFRDNFNIPTKGSLRKKALNGSIPEEKTTNGTAKVNGHSVDDEEPSTYFVGNSLGAQPKCMREHLNAHLETWASIGVNGHFTSFENSPLAAWQDMAADCAQHSVDLVGAASPSEVIYMNTLTVNLHLMMATFYRPTEKRHKIIAEWKPFPSDSYAIASQLQLHSLTPSTSLIDIHPDPQSFSISTASILATIDAHADSTALLLLPGIQYYTGQLFDIPRITAHAHSKGIPYVGWDLAHAAGNVPLSLHDWGVDFAVWCTYKYLNAGPGAIAGCFVHEKHHNIPDPDGRTPEGNRYLHRLAGWYGAEKSVRFNMEKVFQPAEGGCWVAGVESERGGSGVCEGRVGGGGEGWGIGVLRGKGLVLTAYLEALLDGLVEEGWVVERRERARFR